MNALKDVSRVWLVGKMVYTLFEAILGNKGMEEKLQKASGKRHRKMQQSLAQLDQHARADAGKRKYNDMAMDYGVNSAPTPQESYERSRPQTPTAKAEPAVANSMPPPVTSPNAVRPPTDAFMGGTASRPHTRPTTPFNPSFSVPGTPPDLYLVTRNSPNLSQAIWENFQPDQLFPESSILPFPQQSPTVAPQNVDPNLVSHIHGTSGLQTAASGEVIDGTDPFHQQQQQQQQQQDAGKLLHDRTLSQRNNLVQPPMAGFNTAQMGNLWQTGFDTAMQDGMSPSDSWSTGSAQGQPIPTALNVEDWFQFFGINGDANNLNLDVSMT